MSTDTSILIIDDDQTTLRLLEEVIGQEPGYEVRTLSSSTEALALLEERRFDLVITDLRMPGPGGLDILDHVRRHHADSLVVIMTGFSTLETTLEAIRAGVYDYITKPFRIEEFRLLVRNATERLSLEREAAALAREMRSLRRQKGELEETARRQSDEIRRLNTELGRLDELLAASGARPHQGDIRFTALSAYERDRPAARRRRPTIKELDDQFAAGLLTPDEYEAARQRLKAVS